jgi:uncharacterized membrane protein YhaH (DUF805 family)
MNPFDFKGRIGRHAYAVSLTALLTVTAIVSEYVTSVSDKGPSSSFGWACVILVGAGLWLFLSAQSAKRLHDLGWSGWWSVTTLVPRR